MARSLGLVIELDAVDVCVRADALRLASPFPLRLALALLLGKGVFGRSGTHSCVSSFAVERKTLASRL